MMNYHDFLASKSQLTGGHGFEPIWLPDYLFGFQRYLDEWTIRRGRAGIFAGCGLGKGPMLLVWAENVVRHTNRPVLVVTTLGDSEQMVREAGKFEVEAVRSRDGKVPPGARVVVTNYERLEKFNPDDFSGVAANEASILKNVDGKTRSRIIEFLRTIPLRTLWTATAAPNDWDELGNSAEALGELGYEDMLTKFFTKQHADRGGLGWGQMKIKIRGHAERDFWRWVCSWSRACRKPSDLGFPDDCFALPPLFIVEHVVEPTVKRKDMLYDMPAVTMQERREENRRTMPDRCELVARLANHDRPVICWVHLNDEGNLLEEMIPDSAQVAGSDSDDVKEERILAFMSSQVRVLISKPRIMGFGLNLQHCAHQTYFISDSWEAWYQAVRRCWRFGQQNPVTVDMISTPGSQGVMDNLNRKQAQAETMFARMVELMHNAMSIDRSTTFAIPQEVPAWLS